MNNENEVLRFFDFFFRSIFHFFREIDLKLPNNLIFRAESSKWIFG